MLPWYVLLLVWCQSRVCPSQEMKATDRKLAHFCRELPKILLRRASVHHHPCTFFARVFAPTPSPLLTLALLSQTMAPSSSVLRWSFAMTVAASLPAAVTPLNNGLGLTPAMGYSSWNDCSSMRDNGPDGWCWNAEDHVKNLTRYFIDSGLAGGWWVRKSRHAVGVCVFVTAASYRRCCLAPPQPCCIRPRARP